MIDQKEAKRLLEAIDCLASRLFENEKNFVMDMIDNWHGYLTKGHGRYIPGIAKRHNII